MSRFAHAIDYLEELDQHFDRFVCHTWGDYYPDGQVTDPIYNSDTNDPEGIKEDATDAHSKHILALGSHLWFQVSHLQSAQ